MKTPSYPGAMSVAASVVAHLERQATTARELGREDLARPPGTRAVEMLIDAAFWASFRREEGRPPRISLAFLPPDDAENPMTVAHRLPLQPSVLAHLSPAVERPGIHLGVWCNPDGYYVWGTTRKTPALCLVVEVVQPGLLVVKHTRLQSSGKYANVAVLEGDTVKVIDEKCIAESDCPTFLRSLLGTGAEATADVSHNVLVQLCMSMRAHEHGGTLLVVPSDSDGWHASIVWTIHYRIAPAFDGLAGAVGSSRLSVDEGDSDDAFMQAIRSVGGLTAVDGATILSDRYELLAFGAKIGRAKGSAPIDRIILAEPILGQKKEVVHPTELGGTRHLSAAQFAKDQRKATALVASQDGRFTVFSWSHADEMVQAHRIETLLM